MKEDKQAIALPPAEYTALPPEIAPPPPEITPEGVTQPEAEQPNKRRKLRFLLYAAAALVYLGLLYSPAEGEASAPSAPAAAEMSAVVTPMPAVSAEPTPEPTPAPTPTPTPEPTPTPTPELTLDRVCGTYYVEGTGVVDGDRQLYFIDTGTQTASRSGPVTITSAGENLLAMTATVVLDNVTTGEGSYTYDGNTGTATFVDSLGHTVTLVFMEENGQITLSMSMVAYVEIGSASGTLTITLSGSKN